MPGFVRGPERLNPPRPVKRGPGLSARAIYQTDMGVPGAATPQQKILAVTRSMGINDADIMQATTRTIFDALPTNGATTFEFFKGVQSRVFPFTNLSENKLEVGEALIIEKIFFYTMTAATPPKVDNIGGITTLAGISFPCQFSFTIANADVIKPYDLCTLMNFNNIDSEFLDQEYLKMSTLLCIPAMQEFYCTLQTQANVATADTYVGIGIKGTGIIYKSNSPL